MRIELVNLDSVVKTWSAVPWVQSLVEALASCFSLPTSAAVLSTFWVWSKPSYQNLGFQMLKVPSDFRDGAVCSAPRVSGCCWTPFFFSFFFALRRWCCSCWRRPSGFAFRILVVAALCHSSALDLFHCLFGMTFFFLSSLSKCVELQKFCTCHSLTHLYNKLLSPCHRLALTFMPKPPSWSSLSSCSFWPPFSSVSSLWVHVWSLYPPVLLWTAQHRLWPIILAFSFTP